MRSSACRNGNISARERRLKRGVPGPGRHVVGEAAAAIVFQRRVVFSFCIDNGEPHVLAAARTQHARNTRMQFVRAGQAICIAACCFGTFYDGTHDHPRCSRDLNATGSFPFRNAAMLSLRSKCSRLSARNADHYATWPGSIVFGVCSASCLVRGAGGSSGEPFTPPSSRSASSSSVVRSRRCDFGRITGRDIGASDERRPHPVFDAGWGRSGDFTTAGLFAVRATWTLHG